MAMECARYRQVMISRFQEETLDDDLLHSAWYSWTRDRAESAIAEFLLTRDGNVSTLELALLYEQRPWLVKTVGSLRTFCEQSTRLLYQPRAGQHTARVTLTGYVQVVPITLCDDDVEVYHPRWMSRKVLNTQLRSCWVSGVWRRPPMRFDPCRRVERRRKAKAWMQDFLNVFFSNEYISVEDLLCSTRVWPDADEYQNTERAKAVRAQADPAHAEPG